MSCSALLPQNDAPRPGVVRRLTRRLAQLVAFTGVLAAFGLSFWALSHADPARLREILTPPDRAPDAPPADTPTQPSAAPPTIVLRGDRGALRFPAGESAWLDLGHDGHRLKVAARVEDDRILLDLPEQPDVAAHSGDTVTLLCEETRLEGTAGPHGIVMEEVACPRTVTVVVELHRSPAGGPAAPDN